jgi:hypothetical protein
MGYAVALVGLYLSKIHVSGSFFRIVGGSIISLGGLYNSLSLSFL